MKLLVVLAAFAHVAISGHVAVRMPYLNPANVAYQFQSPAGHAAFDYEYSQQAFGYGDAHQQGAYDAPAPLGYSEHLSYHGNPSVGYAQVPVRAAVAVPTVHHVPTVADVPVTKYEAQPAVIQKIVDVAKPATKTRKYEVRRPAIQKQFYDIEERTIIRPVGSALVELDEPLSKAQKGPAIVTTADGHQSIAEEHGYAVPHAVPVAVAPAHTVSITPSPHGFVSTIAPLHHDGHVAITPTVGYNHYDTPYLHKQQEHVLVSSTPAPIHFSTPDPLIISSTPLPHYASDDSVIIEAAARHVAHAEHAAHEAHLAHEEAIARAQINAKHAHLAVEAISNGSPYEHKIVAAHDVHHDAVHNLNHLSHEEAHQNQQRLIKLLTAKGGVAEVGFGRAGHSEHVGDAGISRARVLSATPSPHHEPVEEKVNTRRIVVSRPVQTLQEIDVVEPATKIERIAVNQPTLIKTAKVGVERVHTSVPVYGKSYAPALAHAQVPVEYYHH